MVYVWFISSAPRTGMKTIKYVVRRLYAFRSRTKQLRSFEAKQPRAEPNKIAQMEYRIGESVSDLIHIDRTEPNSIDNINYRLATDRFLG